MQGSRQTRAGLRRVSPDFGLQNNAADKTAFAFESAERMLFALQRSA
jgi:hypothetical protein